MSGKAEKAHICCACFTHNGLPCCNPGHLDLIGARTVQRAWDSSPLLRSVKAAREESGAIARHRFNNDLRYRADDHERQRQLTPPYVLEPVRQALGSIELDPCTEPDNPTAAERFYIAETDGAEQPWDAGTIYVNPPYSKARERWVKRCIEAAANGSRVILLMPSHTDTRLFHLATETASHVVFIKGRVKFGILRENRRQEAASHPSCLIGWNLVDVAPLAPLGRIWHLSSRPGQPEATR
ncbi:MAG: hypothetical protein EPO65_00460 [Dehalococcoidia bacterium]|nr:MAG: hypothetical protein EPO65_00460 [Dehalococcoidia bacterium]